MVNPLSPSIFADNAIPQPGQGGSIFASGVKSIGFPSLGGVQQTEQGQAPTIEDVERPIFEAAFGFFPTINLGNAFGIENDTARTLVNILLDPITLGLAFFSGGASLAGKAAASTKALAATKSVLKAAPGVTSAARVKNSQKILKTLVQAEKNPKALAALKNAVAAEDTKGFLKASRALTRTPVSSSELLKIIPNRKELFELEKLSKAEKGLARAGKTLKDIDLVEGVTRVSKIEKGQAAFLKFKVPVVGVEKVLIEGKPIAAFLDKILPASAGLGKATVKKLAKTKIAASTVGELFKNLQNSRYVSTVESAQDANKIRKGFTEQINKISNNAVDQGLGDIISFVREKKGIPTTVIAKLGLTDDFVKAGFTPTKLQNIEIYTDDALKIVLRDKGWLDGAEQGNKMLGSYFEELRVMMNTAGVGDKINYIEDYITHFWDLDKTQAVNFAKSFAKRGLMQNQRKFESFVFGMNKGFTPKFTDAFQISEEYHKIMGRVIANKQMLQTLKKSDVLVDGVLRPVSLISTRSKLAKAGVLSDFEKITDDRILKALGKTKGQSLYVHKELAKNLDVMFAKPLDNAASRFLDNFVSSAKTLALSSSFFHSFALVESSMATLGARTGFIESARLGFGLPFIRAALKKVGVKDNPLIHMDDVIADAKLAGLNVSTPSDVQFSIVSKNLEFMQRQLEKIPGAGAMLSKMPKGYFDLFNKPLWENFHNPMKVIAYDNRLTFLKKTNPNMPLEELKRVAAQFTNDAFGGQNWEALMVNKKFQQQLHWALLAPDWTISNLRIAGAVGRTPEKILEGIRGTARGAFGKGITPSEDLRGAYWRNAIPIFFGAVALANKASSGHWPWENAPGHELDIELPDRDEKGRIQYTKLGKQFREPFRWLTEPTKILGAKTSPIVQVLFEQLSGSSPTGFPTEFGQKFGQPAMTFMESTPERLKSIVDKFVPFSFRGGTVFLALPKSTFTNAQATKEVIKAMRGSKGSGADPEKVEDILNLAQAAGLDVGSIKGQVKRMIGDPRGILDNINPDEKGPFE